MNKPILCLDFDGVLHSYTSGWKGAAVIPDEPVPGALEFIFYALPSFRVAIHSSRSHQWGGKRAMRRWLNLHYQEIGDPCPKWWRDYVCYHGGMEPWHIAVRDSAARIVRQIEFPWFKPPALVTLDDRALQFTGTFPPIRVLLAFKPWNKP